MQHKRLCTWCVVLFSGLTVTAQTTPLSDYRWTLIDAKGEVTGRHENAFVEYKGKFYLLGGRGANPVNVFDPRTNTWEKLFNGENLDGWQIKCQEKDKGQTFWSVDKGAIYCNSLGSNNHGYVWLQSEKEFGDFALRLKFKVSRQNRGNSGIQIRSRYDENAIVDEGGDAGWLDGPQVDIEPTNPWRNGLIYDETRETKRWINPSLPDWKIDKETWAPKRVIFYWEDEESGWNEMTIICQGTHIKTIVNNVVVSDYDGAGILDDKAHKKHNVGMYGYIALQLHKNSENIIWFKDIEIRELN
ncbi:DUF1080 domain-containing protein [candidate division KSB1 bacterium]|nr:MAG: DUF1080 domain-containing protein [candidate division KSB1 bacterium]